MLQFLIPTRSPEKGDSFRAVRGYTKICLLRDFGCYQVAQVLLLDPAFGGQEFKIRNSGLNQ